MNWTVLAHIVVALAILGTTAALAALNVISGNDAFTVIIAVGTGAGVLAGANLSGSQTPTPPSLP